MRRCVVIREQIRKNARVVRRLAGGALVYGVLKADGYGMSLEPMAQTLAAEGIERFAVTEPEDAVRLAELGLPVREILLLKPVGRESCAALLRYGAIAFSVGSPEDAVTLAREGLRQGIRPRVHIQIDTGLGRYGFRWDEPSRVQFLYKSFKVLDFAGIYTHFAGTGRQAKRQYSRFCRILDSLKAEGIDPGLRHCAASSALLRHPEMVLDAVRIGSAFLGRVAGGADAGLSNACRYEATLETVRSLRPGDTVGYGARFRVRRKMRIAAADIGTLHGLGMRTAEGKQCLSAAAAEIAGKVRKLFRGADLRAEIGGVSVPVLGRICTECVLLDVTDVDCGPGDLAVFSVNPMAGRLVESVWLPAEDGGEAPPLMTDTPVA